MIRSFGARGARTAVARLAALALLAAACAAAVAAGPAAHGVAGTYQATLVQTVDMAAFAPPSPDPAGIAYLPASGRLLVADSEVEELALYRGANLYEVSPNGTLARTGLTTAYSSEPTGLAFDPAQSILYVTDDDAMKMFLVRPGVDGVLGTADDTSSSFGLAGFGTTDPQGVAYNSATGDLFLVDGGENKVFRISAGPNGTFEETDAVVGFGMGGYGAGRPQGIAYDARRGSLFVCDHRSKALYEVDAAGTLLATVDISAAALPGGCDVAVAPSSTVSGASSFWVTTRGRDSQTDPNQNDGKLYELSANLPPRPGQGIGAASVVITAPAGGSTVAAAGTTLSATAVDGDGRDLTSSIAWASDRDGSLGAGGEIHPSLSVGRHTITASVSGAGGTASAKVVVDVVEHPVLTGQQQVPGYRLVASDGGIFAYGDAGFHGSTGATQLAEPIVGMAPTPSNKGYWLFASDGGIFAYGDAKFHGSTGDIRLARPIVGMAPTPSGSGYWLVAADGGIFAYGDAGFHGSTGDIRLARPIVGMAPTPSGSGYWLVASDGGLFAYGDAGFHGSTGDIELARPIVAMTPTATGKGYWMVASDGGMFAFGDAGFFGSTGDIPLVEPIVGMSRTATGRGYWLVASDGGIFAFGDATFLGSTGDVTLAKPIVGMAGR